MKKALLLMVMALTPALVAAQEAKQQTPAPSDLTVKAFEVKPGNLDRVWVTVRMIVGDANVRADRDLNMLIVKTTPQLMPAVEEIVKRLDVAAPPPKNIEFTIYVLEVAREPLPDGTIPPDLQPTVNQLRTALGFQGVRLADKAILQGRPGDRVQFTGTLTGAQPPTAPSDRYSLSLQPKLLPDEKPPVVQIDSLELTFSPGAGGPSGNLRTSINLREGQKVVVGKTALGPKNLVLVLSTKVLN